MSQGTCVVVGVGPGIGLAVARRFGKEGYKVALVARQESKLAEYVTLMEHAGISANPYPTDIADYDSIRATFDRIKAEMGNPEVLVYNASASTQCNPSELPVETLLDNFKVNVGGALVAAQQVIPAMRENRQGTILFTGGGLALNPFPQYSSLAVGKAGIRNLAYSLAGELLPYGIHVATVTVTGFVKPGTHFDPDVIAETFWHLHQQPAGHRQREIVYN